jgi:hypothetical protein
MILGVKWRNIFSAHRKPNIGLGARNGEGKNPKQTAEERNSYQTRFLFILPIPGAEPAGESLAECWTLMIPQTQILQDPWKQVALGSLPKRLYLD